MLHMSTAAKIADDQFIDATSSSGSGTAGKKAMMKTRDRYAMARMLTGSPIEPIDHFAASICALDSLRQTKQLMQTIYEIIKVPEPSDTRLLNATVLPMLINDSRTEITTETMTALTGTFSPG